MVLSLSSPAESSFSSFSKIQNKKKTSWVLFLSFFLSLALDCTLIDREKEKEFSFGRALQRFFCTGWLQLDGGPTPKNRVCKLRLKLQFSSKLHFDCCLARHYCGSLAFNLHFVRAALQNEALSLFDMM